MSDAPYKILVMETDHFLREKISGVLSRRGDVQTVAQVSSVEHLKRTVVKMQPDIVLVDLCTAASEKSVLKQVAKLIPEAYIVCLSDYLVSESEYGGSISECYCVIKKGDVYGDFDKILKKLKKRRQNRTGASIENLKNGKVRILVADDDSFYRKRIRNILAAASISCIIHKNGLDLIDCLEGESIDCGCIILDVHMEGVDGIEVASLVRKRSSSMPIIFVSSDDTPETAEKALNISNCSFISKPFNEKDFLRTVLNSIVVKEEKTCAENTDR